jgi:hypothetical protein
MHGGGAEMDLIKNLGLIMKIMKELFDFFGFCDEDGDIKKRVDDKY